MFRSSALTCTNVLRMCFCSKFASKTRVKVGRALSFNKTPNKLKRAMSTMMSPFGSQTGLTPSSQLAGLQLAALPPIPVRLLFANVYNFGPSSGVRYGVAFGSLTALEAAESESFSEMTQRICLVVRKSTLCCLFSGREPQVVSLQVIRFLVSKNRRRSLRR